MHVWFWVWVALAVILICTEVMTGGFLTLPFGIGAAAAALLELLGTDVAWQWLAFVGVSSVLLVILQRFTRGSVRHSSTDRADR